MKKLKMLASILLILVLCLGIYPTTSQAAEGEGYKITITNTEGKENHTYKAYQIFTGTVATEGEGETKQYVLSNIFWGNDILDRNANKELSEETIAAIKAELGAKYNNCLIAENFADVLATMKEADNSEELIKFVDVIYNNVLNVDGGTELTYNETTQKYEGTVTETGYYVIIDVNSSTGDIKEEDVFSKYILQVVGDVDVNSKSDMPNLTKTLGNKRDENGVLTSNVNEKVNTAIIDESKPVFFKLESKIPRMDGYSSYNFVITDTLGEGFDLNTDDLTVKIVDKTEANPDAEPPVVPAEDVVLTKDVDYTISTSDKTILTITFNNFIDKKEYAGKYVVVDYQALLNENAKRGSEQNINSAILTYSNDPHSNSQGKTKPQETKTFTINFVLTKVNQNYLGQTDKKDETGKRLGLLPGATFGLWEKGTEDDETKKIELGPTNENGEIRIPGMGSGTYILKEIKQPDGYNLLTTPIEFSINATYDEATGNIRWSIPDITDAETGKDIRDKLTKFAVLSIGEEQVDLEVGNVKGIILPSTGGIGTVIFTVVGIGIMAGSATLAFGTNKKKRK